MTGTSPGTSQDGVQVPLNVDSYTLFTLAHPNTAVLSNSFNFFDGSGNSSASFNLPAGLDPSFVGLPFNHAYVAIDFTPGPKVKFASNAFPCDVAP